jgi:ketosteroid isomerase-like protein
MGMTSGRYVQVESGSHAIQGRYIVVWRKDAAGQWRALSEIRTPDPLVGEPVRLGRRP